MLNKCNSLELSIYIIFLPSSLNLTLVSYSSVTFNLSFFLGLILLTYKVFSFSYNKSSSDIAITLDTFLSTFILSLYYA